MSGDSGDQRAPRKAPTIEARFEVSGLKQATKDRVERLLERSLSQELSRDPEALAVMPDIITVGLIGPSTGGEFE